MFFDKEKFTKKLDELAAELRAVVDELDEEDKNYEKYGEVLSYLDLAIDELD